MSTAWYFAYGSNMQRATLCGRRGVEVLRALPGRVPGWRLVFDKPPLLPVLESYANIVNDPAAEVLGVLYQIAATDLEHIDLTEGVLIGNYRRIEVPVQPLSAPDGPAIAFTLFSDRRDPELQPSQRYMQMLIEGAVEHGLPDEYVEYLRSIPACAESEESKRMRAFLDQALKRPR